MPWTQQVVRAARRVLQVGKCYERYTRKQHYLPGARGVYEAGSAVVARLLLQRPSTVTLDPKDQIQLLLDQDNGPASTGKESVVQAEAVWPQLAVDAGVSIVDLAKQPRFKHGTRDALSAVDMLAWNALGFLSATDYRPSDDQMQWFVDDPAWGGNDETVRQLRRQFLIDLMTCA